MKKYNYKSYNPVNFTGFFIFREVGIESYENQIKSVLIKKHNLG